MSRARKPKLGSEVVDRVGDLDPHKEYYQPGPYGLRQLPHAEAAGFQGHVHKQVHAPLGLETAEDRKRDKLAYLLGRTWSAKGWPRSANPYGRLTYPVEHAGFNRGWDRWMPHWASKGVIFRTKDQLDEYERFMIKRYILMYAKRVRSQTMVPASNHRKAR